MRNFDVTIQSPGLYGDSSYYSTVTVRCGSAERAKVLAVKRNGGGIAVAANPAAR